MTLFRDKYHVGSARLQSCDYTRTARYFVTLCTKDRACCLGDVVEAEVVLSHIGRIVTEEWKKTPLVRPNIELGAWQIMPNHLHGILAIKDTETAHRKVSETPRRGVSTAIRPRLKAGSLGSIIGQFKSACTKRILAAGFCDFAWQTRFYDHIIRN